MNILLFGRGVISTLYGWALENAGHTVDFYVRPGRAAQFGSTVRLNIHDLRQPEAQQHVVQNWTIHLRENLPVQHDYDLIFVSLAHYQLADAVNFLSTRASRATILLFSNSWEDPQVTTAALPQDQLVWGFPAAGGGFQPNGALYGALFSRVEFGTFGTEPSERAVVVQQMFQDAGFVITEHRNFREWLWVHFAVSAALTAQQLQAGSSRRAVYANHNQTLEAAVRIVRELMPVLAARGVVVEQHPELTFFNQSERQVTESLGQLLQSPAFQAVIEGHANPQELRRMYSDVLVESRRIGIPVPLFEAAARFLDQKNAE